VPSGSEAYAKLYPEKSSDNVLRLGNVVPGELQLLQTQLLICCGSAPSKRTAELSTAWHTWRSLTQIWLTVACCPCVSAHANNTTNPRLQR
jgi:hypothetical protein